MKKSLKIILITISIIVGLFVIASLLITPITTSYIHKNGEELLGRKIDVDKVKVNIYNGKVAINNFKLYEADNETEWVTFDTLSVNANFFKLLSHQLYLKHIHLSGLNLKIYQKGSEFNFSSFFQYFAPEDTIKVKPKKQWKFSFYDIHIYRSQVYYADLQRKCDWDLKDINFQAPGFSIGDHKATNAGLSIQLADGGTLRTKANYDINTNDFAIDLELEQIDLGNIQPYLSEISNIGKTQGMLNAKLRAEGNISHLLDMNLTGDLNIKNLDLKAKSKEQICSFNHLNATINKINIGKKYYDLGSVKIKGLSYRLDIFEDSNSFRKVFPKNTKKTKEQRRENLRKLQLRITDFKLIHGTFIYADHNLCEPLELPITNISINADHFSIHSANTANITATLPHKGTANIVWSGSLINWKSYQQVELDLKNVQLADLAPYTITYLGYPFTNGALSLQSTNSIRNSQINAMHHIHISDAELGKKRTDIEPQFKIALKPVLYALTDTKGNIDIDLPITGDLNNPEFKYQKAIWNAIGNFLLKVISEPFRFAANAFGITNTDRFITVHPTDKEFNNSQLKAFKKFANATKKEPTLMLHFEQQVDPTSEDFILELAEQRDQQLYNYLTQTLKVDPSRFTITSVDIEDIHRFGYKVSGELIVPKE